MHGAVLFFRPVLYFLSSRLAPGIGITIIGIIRKDRVRDRRVATSKCMEYLSIYVVFEFALCLSLACTNENNI